MRGSVLGTSEEVELPKSNAKNATETKSDFVEASESKPSHFVRHLTSFQMEFEPDKRFLAKRYRKSKIWT